MELAGALLFDDAIGGALLFDRRLTSRFVFLLIFASLFCQRILPTLFGDCILTLTFILRRLALLLVAPRLFALLLLACGISLIFATAFLGGFISPLFVFVSSSRSLVALPRNPPSNEPKNAGTRFGSSNGG